MSALLVNVSTRTYPCVWTWVDEQEAPRLTSGGKWCVARKGGDRLYVVRMNPATKRLERMHRFVLGLADDDDRVCDHINGDRLDNRRCNLRAVTQQQNTWNTTSRAGSSSKYLGVSWQRSRSSWRVRIKVDGREIHVGRFVCEIEAAKAYDKAARDKFGEFANLNFPDAVA